MGVRARASLMITPSWDAQERRGNEVRIKTTSRTKVQRGIQIKVYGCETEKQKQKQFLSAHPPSPVMMGLGHIRVVIVTWIKQQGNTTGESVVLTPKTFPVSTHSETPTP